MQTRLHLLSTLSFTQPDPWPLTLFPNFRLPAHMLSHPVIIPVFAPPRPRPPPHHSFTPFSPSLACAHRHREISHASLSLNFPPAFHPIQPVLVRRGCLVLVRTSENSSNLNYTNSFITLPHKFAKEISPKSLSTSCFISRQMDGCESYLRAWINFSRKLEYFLEYNDI